MLKDGPSLARIGMRYGMRGSEGLFHTFGPTQADLAELITFIIFYNLCHFNLSCRALYRLMKSHGIDMAREIRDLGQH